jgi:hypothetical protein
VADKPVELSLLARVTGHSAEVCGLIVDEIAAEWKGRGVRVQRSGTAVQMATMAGRYTISGDGYSTIGQINHAGGQPDVPLEQFLLPMALCADAEVRDGALVGDPTEGRSWSSPRRAAWTRRSPASGTPEWRPCRSTRHTR